MIKPIKIETENCYFEIITEGTSISVRKVATKVTNDDQIQVLPFSSNKIFIH